MKTDVLIIGAGPTGLLLANFLGSMGVPTLVIERNTKTVAMPRAVSIDDESMRTIQSIGLDRDLDAIIQKGYGSICTGRAGDVFAEVKPVSREFGFEKRNAFRQPELEALLHRGANRFDCVSILFNTEMISFSKDTDGVTAAIDTRDQGKIEISAKYMVACDGGRSPTRKLLGIKMLGSSFKEPWLIVDLISTKNRQFHTEVFCNPSRPCITLPGPNGTRRYEFKLAPDETAEQAETENFARTLLDQFGPDRNEPFVRVQVYTFHARVASRWREGRIFLAGDAAHLTPPFAGQGLNSGLRDAHNLAWKLSEAVAKPVNDDFLESYETERRPHAWSMIQLAMRMGAIMMPTSHWQGALVRFAFHALGIYPPARDYIAQMRYKPKPRFTGGLIWSDEMSSSQTIVGNLFPQPMIEGPDGEIQLFDQILPDHPILLIYAERPEEAIHPDVIHEFEALGASVVGITPEWMKPFTSRIPTYRDASRLLSNRPYIDYLNRALLLRRDRYVAASSEVAKIVDLKLPLKSIRPG